MYSAHCNSPPNKSKIKAEIQQTSDSSPFIAESHVLFEFRRSLLLRNRGVIKTIRRKSLNLVMVVNVESLESMSNTCTSLSDIPGYGLCR